MFKCTHCHKQWHKEVEEKVNHRTVKEDDTCLDCGDGVLRPVVKEQPSVRT